MSVGNHADSCRFQSPALAMSTLGDGVWAHLVKVKVKEVDLYCAFIEVPYTQGAQVRITQCYLQITLYLPLPRKHSPDGASQTEVADI